MRKIFLLLFWLPTSILCLILSILLLNSYSRVRDGDKYLALQAKTMLPMNGYQLYAALPEVLSNFSTTIAKEDARPEILRQFLDRHESPLVEFADTIVSASDVKGVDFRLITAIGMCESNLGRNMPDGSYNAWGYAIYTGQSSGASFKNWNQAILTMAEYLSTKYYSRGLTTPEEIGPIYAPPSVETGNSWAKCVRRFIDELL